MSPKTITPVQPTETVNPTVEPKVIPTTAVAVINPEKQLKVKETAEAIRHDIEEFTSAFKTYTVKVKDIALRVLEACREAEAAGYTQAMWVKTFFDPTCPESKADAMAPKTYNATYNGIQYILKIGRKMEVEQKLLTKAQESAQKLLEDEKAKLAASGAKPKEIAKAIEAKKDEVLKAEIAKVMPSAGDRRSPTASKDAFTVALGDCYLAIIEGVSNSIGDVDEEVLNTIADKVRTALIAEFKAIWTNGLNRKMTRDYTAITEGFAKPVTAEPTKNVAKHK